MVIFQRGAVKGQLSFFGSSLLGKTSAGRSKLLVSDWSEEDVSLWLVEERLEGLVDAFRANNIDGTELLCLTKETLASELHIGEDHKYHRLLSSGMSLYHFLQFLMLCLRIMQFVRV